MVCAKKEISENVKWAYAIDAFMDGEDIWLNGEWDSQTIVFRKDSLRSSVVSPKVLNKPDKTMALNFAHYYSEN